ncbi:MAG: CPBP family intramembrane metalloprotease [Treponema sp.]|nr:CPBP family intramembrane metalloprotease [Treponema sp.]
MTAFIEAIIIFAVLFFRIFSITAISEPSAAMPDGTAAVIPVEFSVFSETTKIFSYTIPAIALIWYLLLKVKNFKDWGIGMPQKKDIFALLISLPALVLISITIYFVSSFIDPNTMPVNRQLPPQTVFSWSILVFSCICSAFLEESYFRFYLLSKREDMKLNTNTAVILSALLFSYCHFYEGPWGFLNAALSGVVLSFTFLRFRSLYGITAAHALYNILAFSLGTA